MRIKEEILLSEVALNITPNLYKKQTFFVDINCYICKKRIEVPKHMWNGIFKVASSLVPNYGNVYINFYTRTPGINTQNFWSSCSNPEQLIEKRFEYCNKFLCKACIQTELLLPSEEL